jgi:hypothetical protein
MKDDPAIEQLEEANHQLQESLRACHELVAEYRLKLAANRNDPLLFKERDRNRQAAGSRSFPGLPE